MVKHIVMWKLRDKADAAEITGLLNIEVGVDFLESEQSADVVLYSELESREALDSYQNHTEHMAVVPLVKAAAVSRTVVDYEVS